MKKLLLLFVSLFAMGTASVSAADLTLNFGDLYEWWGASYDAENQSMVCTAEWQGLSWFWNDGISTDYYCEVEIVVNSDTDGALQIVVQYVNDEDNANSSVAGIDVTAGEETTLTCEIAQDFEAVAQIAIQAGEGYTGTVKLISATVKMREGADADPYADADYDELPIDNDDDLGSGWSTSYDGATHTITLTGGWGGRGWWFGDDTENEDGEINAGKDCTDYDGIEVAFTTECTGYIQVIVEYNGGGDSGNVGINGSGIGENQYIYVAFDEDYSSSVKQIYVQGQDEGDQITIISAKLIKKASASEGTEEEGTDEEGTDEDAIVVYFDSSDVDWDPVYCYIFEANAPWGTITNAWPGDICTQIDENMWEYVYTGDAELTEWKVIFCNEDGSQQTSPDFIFENGATYNTAGNVDGITSISNTTAVKSGTYNLAGQRVADTTKGLLIKDGKKVIVK